MEEKKVRVAITHGDTNGVGYELIFKTFAAPEMFELCTPIVYGSPKVAAYHRKALNAETAFSIISNADDMRDGRLNLLTCFEEEVKVELGTQSDESKAAGAKALKKAIEDQKNGKFDVLVLNPMALNSEVKRQGLVVMMSDNLRVAFATSDMSLKDVTSKITKENIVSKAEMFIGMLRRDMRISNPRIAVLALNPNGHGQEEAEAITPAVEQLANSGKQAFGPYAADEFFGSGKFAAFDGILAMYYDQGAAPFRALSDDDSILCVAGLPVPCTMPLFNYPQEQAGKGLADESSFRKAIYAAIDICRNRWNYDEPLQNPLPKLFHERRDDSEKVRFAVPNKQDDAPKNQDGAPKEASDNQE